MSTIVACYLINVLLFSFLVEPLVRYQVLNFAVCAFAAGGGLYLIFHVMALAAAAFRRGAQDPKCA